MVEITPKSAGGTNAPQRNLATRWTPALAATGFTPVVDGFLNHYGEIGITSGQAMFLIHLMSYKWTDGMPYPSFTTIAEKMGVSDTSVRAYARKLEQCGLLRRVERPGRTTTFDLTPLFQKLEEHITKPSRK